MGRRYYNAFEYDFNNPHGEVVINRKLIDELGLDVDDSILLVSMEGNRRDSDYDGYATIVCITGFKDAVNPEHVWIMTDLRTRA